jgi:hypothetical protein
MIHPDRKSGRFHWCRCAILLIGGVLAFASIGTAGVAQETSRTAIFVCPMHADMRAAAAGTCAICGMALVPSNSPAPEEYRIDVETLPDKVSAGRPFKLRLSVRHPQTDAVVRQFAAVHERRFHLFVISEDLTHYEHVHPEQEEDGSWVLDLTVPRPGRYRLYSDFLPAGGPAQVVATPIVTADSDRPDAGAPETLLVPDRSLNHTIGQLSVSLETPQDGLRAGRQETFVYHLADAVTGKPVTDVEPYLGAWGHSLAVSEDLANVVHAHPVEMVPEGRPSARGGPTLTFKAELPEPGKYRIWTQIKRNGEIVTAVFTVDIPSAAPAERGAVRNGSSGLRSIPPGDR